MSKKTILVLMVIVSMMMTVFFSSSFAEAASDETYKLTIKIDFEGNLIFSRYNVRLKLDGKQIALMKHGEDYSGTQTVSPGGHVITFVKEDNNSVNGRAEVVVEGDTTFSCGIYVYSDMIEPWDIKVSSIPTGQKKARTTPYKTFSFGRYEQDNKTENGTEPILWYIAEEKDGKAFLISTKTLDNQKYNSSADSLWETSSIRKWLNNTFLSTAFTPEEQEAILVTTIKNQQSDTGEWKRKEAADTEDRVFLLDYREYTKYLQLDEERDSPATEYANKKGSNWNVLLRTPGKNRREVSYFAVWSYDSDDVTNSNAVRPALWVNLETARSSSSSGKYDTAISLERQRKYGEAADIFESLNGFNGSASRAIECRYLQAKQLHDNGDNQAAINILEKMRDYKDSADLLFDYKYSLAIEYEENGEYAKAVELFTWVGQYKQTMEHIRSCYDKMHIQYYWLTRKIGSAVNTGLDTGFAKSDPIKDGDPHYGWGLGRFMISGYTEVKDDGSIPVFIKTPGNSVTLWFDLMQDIDKLNGITNLRISRDINGKDQEFQYPQSDFGRGALLIRHVDFRGSDSEVQPYMDYLSAKNGTGANTRVQLNEEGIYEVALDYEIEGKGTNNYRIYTTFEVKNGSNMFFLFDVASGAELQDYSRTADGFRLDLANSHSLSASYIRYAINQEETGLDVRKKEPVSNGATFEKVGYYEITVTNTETNEQLTKHIFVGREADLEEFQAVDASLSKFSN